MIRYEETNEFKKEFKTLKRKYKSLPKDLKILKKVLDIFPNGNRSSKFSILTKHSHYTIIKARLSCSSLRKSSLRIIYAYSSKENKIDFIELYYKGDEENEDKERIKSYLSSYNFGLLI